MIYEKVPSLYVGSEIYLDNTNGFMELAAKERFINYRFVLIYRLDVHRNPLHRFGDITLYKIRILETWLP